MALLSVSDKVVRKVNLLEQGMWSYLCDQVSRDPRGEQTVERTSHTGAVQFIRLVGIRGSYNAANFVKVNDV